MTTCNRSPSVKRHAELQRGHEPRNSNCNKYKGINSQWRRSETGTRIEMQFHTPESLDAKELTHEAYERLRRPETETSQGERDKLEGYQRQVNTLIATPPYAETIKNFPEKKR